MPDALDSPGHLGEDFRAEVPLAGPTTTTPSGGGLLEPRAVWDDGAATCRDSYCHGNWALPKALSERQWMYSDELMTGNDATPRWDDPGSGACGSCHGLPPVGHDEAALHECVDCHGTVVNGDGEIIDPSRHVDGMIDLYDDPPYPMF